MNILFISRHLLSSQDGANSNGVTAAPMDRVEDVEDILIASAAASDNAGCSSNCRARSGAGRYRCDSEVKLSLKCELRACSHVCNVRAKDLFNVRAFGVLGTHVRAHMHSSFKSYF